MEEEQIQTKEETTNPVVKEVPKVEPKEEVKEEVLKVKAKEKFFELIDAASSIMGEAKIQFADAGMRLAGVDAASVCMCDFRLSADEFEEFKIENDPEIIVNLINLRKILKNLGEKDITLELMGGFLKVSKDRRRFSVPLIAEIETKFEKIPPLNYEGYFAPSKTIKEDIKILTGMKDSIWFELSSSKLIMRCKGDTQSATFDAEGGSMGVNKTQAARYSHEYISKMFDCKGDVKKIEINTDYPIRVTYDYGVIVLAPRVENN